MMRHLAARLLAAAVSALMATAVLAAEVQAQPPDPGEGGLEALAVFDDYVNGSLRTQGSWQVNTPGAADGAFASADVPASLSGKALALMLDGDNPQVAHRGNAYADLGALSIPQEAATSTVFWEFLTEDLSRTDVSLGLSADDSPGLGADTTGDSLDLDDYGPQVTIDARGLVVRDGAEDRVLDASVEDGQILRVWLAIDNADDSFAVYTAAPDESPTIAAAEGQETFAFRTASDAALRTFLLLNDPVDLPTSNSYLDNIYVSPERSTTADPSPAFESTLDFSGQEPGALGGQDGWTAGAGASVAVDPVDSDNQVLRVSGTNVNAHRSVPAIDDASTGTVFFRFRRQGLVDTSLGLTDVDAPAVFGDFRVQANSQRTDSLQVRPASGFTPVGRWADEAWQCVWMVADNSDDSFRVYSRGGPYATTTRLPVDEEAAYAFRSGTASALDTFFLVQGMTSPGTQWVDDISIDQDGVNLRVPSGDAGDCEVTGSADLPLTTPVKETPQPSEVQLHLSEFATIPASSGSGPLARINYFSEVPGREDVYAVPDLNGKTWLVEDGTPREYFDASSVFPDFVKSPSLGTGNGFVAFHPDFATNGLFYTVHTEAGAALTSRTPSLPAPEDTRVHGVLTEWRATDPAASTFEGTRREVLRIGFSRFLHGMQQISFNPTAEEDDPDHGNLYVAVGDGNENPNFAPAPQDLAMPQGKLLRIDPTGADAPGDQYAIPSDNPFVGDSDALGEVWALGFRNPHRFSWDRATGRMFLGMIGEKSIDAVYEVRKGDNAGWNEREGSFLFKKTDSDHVYPLPADDAQYGYDYPVLDIGRNTGGSLSGGFVYRGSDFPDFDGAYLFGDIVTGQIRFTSAAGMQRDAPNPEFFAANIVGPDGEPTTMRALTGSNRVDLRFGSDEEGEIYLISKANGKIWKVTDITGTQTTPACDLDAVTVAGVDAGSNWAPLTPDKWEFPGDQIILTTAGTNPGLPRRPFEYATLTAGPEFGSVQLDAQVRLDEPVAVNNRDVVLIWNYQSPTRFYYAHISQDNRSYAHNGLFVVDDADRLRIDDQWDPDANRGAPPAVDDMDWHDVRVQHCADTGRIALFMDGSDIPLMTATDTTFSGGRVGFGSFDNFGRARNISVSGEPVSAGQIEGLAPSVTGAPVVGAELRAEAGEVSPDDADLAYAWSADGVRVGDDSRSFTPGPDDVGARISVTITATKDGYEGAEATSEPTEPVVAATFEIPPAASFSGVLKVGETLTADTGTPVPGAERFSYQWLADGEPIDGATASTLRLSRGELDAMIAVTVTAHRAGYEPASDSSAPMGPVSAYAAPSLDLAVSRDQARVGEEVTLSWSSEEATSVEAYGDWSGVRSASGSEEVELTAAGAHVYVLTATNAHGSSTAVTTVDVGPGPTDLGVRAPRRAWSDSRAKVRVVGLVAGERAVARIGGRVVGIALANARGRTTVRVRVPEVKRFRSVTVKVRGAYRDRSGRDTLVVKRR